GDGYTVCKHSDAILGQVSFEEAQAFTGCYAYNAASDLDLCLACDDGQDSNDMSAMGAGCSEGSGFAAASGSSCLASGVITAQEGSAAGCNYYDDGTLSGVVCCEQ
ncbi:MAG: hypothetical protein ACPGU1_14555, partial [Myxococcota bacterium]